MKLALNSQTPPALVPIPLTPPLDKTPAHIFSVLFPASVALDSWISPEDSTYGEHGAHDMNHGLSADESSHDTNHGLQLMNL